MQVEIIYDIIMVYVLLCHILHISNGNICGIEHHIVEKYFCNKHHKHMIINFSDQACNVRIKGIYIFNWHMN